MVAACRPSRFSFSCLNDFELIQMQINTKEYHASYQQRIGSNNNKARLLEDPLQSLLIENTINNINFFPLYDLFFRKS